MGKNLRMVGDTLRKSHVSSGSLGRKKEENNTRIFKSRKSKVDESKKTKADQKQAIRLQTSYCHRIQSSVLKLRS